MGNYFCPKCGKELLDDVEYCIECGYNFKSIKIPHEKSPKDLLDGLSTSVGPGRDFEGLEIGEVFSARYEILSKGMRGGMGVVYKCKDKKLGTIKALKIIHTRLLNSDEAIKRFRQEVAISQSLYHKNIVRVYDIDEYEGIEFFTMEWIEGTNLREILTNRKKERRPFTLAEAQKIISQLAEALDHAHKHTIHRDIKPENILITKDEEGI